MTDKPKSIQPSTTRPYHIHPKAWWDIVKDVAIKAAEDHLSVVSAGCAYYALFAIFPALTAMISLYGLTADPDTVEHQFGMLETVLPAQAYDIVIEQIQRIVSTSGRTLGWSFAVSLTIALWSANRGIQAMFSALNIAYGEPERRNILHFYVSAIGYTFIAIVGGAVALFAIVYVPVLFGDAGHEEIYQTLVKYLRWPVFLGLTIFLLTLMYRFGPSRPSPKWEWMSVGSVFAALMWLLASFGFSYYVSNFAHYDRMYGTLGGVIILLFWLYLSFYIVLLGAEINAQVERRIGSNANKPTADKANAKD